MDYRSSRLLAHTDAFPPSSSAFPRRRWSQLNPLHASPVVETVRPLQQTNPYRHEPALDESSRAHRTTALRQLNGNARSSPWKNSHRPATSRPSTVPSQPVLVRAYSGGPHDTSGMTTMPSRRSFPFTGGSGRQRRGPPLPAEADFSIDSILRAIEPNIRHTLDSIGEICGRSRLSLANEYGSHIAPLGEIRAPGGLVTVDEASSDHERQAGNVAIYDDENSLADGRDHSSLSHYRYWDNSRQTTTGAQSRTSLPGNASSAPVQPTTPRSAAALGLTTDESIDSLPTTREFLSKPRSSGRTLLGNQMKSDTPERTQSILTPALVSEILLDAQAESPSGKLDSPPQESPNSHRPLSTGASALMAEVHALLGWLRQASLSGGSDGSQATAEMRLRAMLERYENTANA